MDIRYSCNQRDFKRYTTEETRNEFLITGLYKADEVVAVYSHVDRMVVLGCMPVNESVSIDKGIDVWANFGTHYFLERREIGIFNLGGEGTVVADGVSYPMNYKPTSAFKDVALCMLPQLMSKALQGRDEKVMILTATSGDTGKAALSGFQDAENIAITVFYPQGKVSNIQRLQMVTQPGKNVCVCAIEGNFDDAQSGVKRLFQSDMAKQLKEKEHVVLSSANSINIGRLIPQIVYYFSAYRQLLEKNEIAMGDKVSFCVPTGNFGNVLAGYYAKLMGLPVAHLVVAANENKVLDDFLRSGVYDRNRPFHTTISPSMDILISSNLERMLYYMCGKDSEKVKGWMDDLAKYGRYQVDEQTLSKIREIFVSGHCDNADTFEEIYRVYDACGYVMDPHTAVGSYVLRQLQLKEKCVLLSTASPYKFTRDVLKALKEQPSDDDFVCMEQLSDYAKTVIPQGLYSLKDKEERFSDVISCEKMDAYVEEKTKELLV